MQRRNSALYILKKIKGIGDSSIRKLLLKGFDPDSFFRKDFDYLKSFSINQIIIDAFLAYDQEKVFNKFLDFDKKGIRVISCLDDEYPVSLSEIKDFPLLLYAVGDVSLLDSKKLYISVVGTRICDEYGKKSTHYLVRELAQNNTVIVSGMAEGIDTEAHRAALDVEGKTIAVLGGGFNNIFPKSNEILFDEIKEKGLVITEHEPDIMPKPHYFPVRNRIITGLSEATIIVQGTIKSGAMISANLALDQGRDVFAVPGSIFSELSFGPNTLISEGARPITSAQDVIEEYDGAFQHTLFSTEQLVEKPEEELERMISKLEDGINAESLSGLQRKIAEFLGEDPVSADIIADALGEDISSVMSELLFMELEDVVFQHPGKMFSRN